VTDRQDGSYEARYRVTEHGGNFSIRLDLLSRTTNGLGGSGLTGSYFSNALLEGEPEIVRVDSTVDFSEQNEVLLALRKNKVSVRWQGYLVAPATDVYVFSIDSNQRVDMWVDDRPVMNKFPNTTSTSTLPIFLTQSVVYCVKIEILVARPPAYMRWNWRGTNTQSQIVPRFYLYPVANAIQNAPFSLFVIEP
jgi:hypothetical protein